MKQVKMRVLALTIGLFFFQLSVNAENLNIFGTKFDRQFNTGIMNFSTPLFTQRDYYGAIAFSQSTGATGGAWDHYSEGEAARAAVNACGRSDCRAVYIFWNTCGALAVGDRGGWGTGRGPDRYSAESYARSSCRSAGNTNCRDYYWVCTTRY